MKCAHVKPERQEQLSFAVCLKRAMSSRESTQLKLGRDAEQTGFLLIFFTLFAVSKVLHKRMKVKMPAEEALCIYDFDSSGAKISPSLHSCDTLCSAWPIPAEHTVCAVCAGGNSALLASHPDRRATRVSHTAPQLL